ncbi:MAG: D-alanine--D-alanine ligase [Verrucomicrobia bacterium]|nr:D-alanine--D-alanine ligase [Verrucomicrobiota bacterium]
MHSFLAGQKVVVLCGGPGAEREVSLRSGAAVGKALRALDAEVVLMDAGADGTLQLPDAVDVVFNALHGTFGEDGTVQRLLEEQGVPYTGENVAGSRLAFDKIASKQRFIERGVPTAAYITVRRGDSGRPSFALPAVVKVPCQGSSVGIYIVRTEAEFDAAVAAAFAQTGEILIEEFVEGRELTVGILGRQALPVIEIRPKGGFYSYENKYTWTNRGGAAEHECPAALDPAVTRLVQETALAAHRALDLEVYSRVDVILDRRGRPYVLEVNTIPGMTETSLLPEAAGVAGLSMPKLCEKIVELSLDKRTSNQRQW